MSQTPQGQQHNHHDVESQPVNVTPIPVAQQTVTHNDLDVM